MGSGILTWFRTATLIPLSWQAKVSWHVLHIRWEGSRKWNIHLRMDEIRHLMISYIEMFDVPMGDFVTYSYYWGSRVLFHSHSAILGILRLTVSSRLHTFMKLCLEVFSSRPLYVSERRHSGESPSRFALISYWLGLSHVAMTGHNQVSGCFKYSIGGGVCYYRWKGIGSRVELGSPQLMNEFGIQEIINFFCSFMQNKIILMRKVSHYFGLGV